MGAVVKLVKPQLFAVDGHGCRKRAPRIARLRSVIGFRRGDKINIGDIVFEIMSAPGHTEGGVMYYAKDQKAIFTGDTIFMGSIGRTDFPGGSITVLLNTLQKIKRLPEDVKIYSGHGEVTTVKHETAYNMYLR